MEEYDANHSGHRHAMTELSNMVKTTSAKYQDAFNRTYLLTGCLIGIYSRVFIAFRLGFWL